MPTSEPQRPRGSCLPVLLALLGAIGGFAGLFALTGGAVAVAVPILVASLVFGMAAVHYLIWGWWLSSLIHRQAEAEREDEESPPQ